MKAALLLSLLASVWSLGLGEETKIEAPCVGIDLGTTYSVVGIWQKDKVEIIPNELGNRITPSVVAFTGEERLVGDAARNQIESNHQNTVYAVKRLMGRQYEDESVQKDKKVLSYGVTRDQSGRAAVVVEYKGERKVYKPEEISAMVLQKMKEIAETFLGTPVKNAVVTVPAYFNDAQRQSTKDAGTIAGLNVARIINEPTAAAIAFGMDQEDAAERKVLVFDLGGGTFDVSLLNIEDGFFEVLATNGDTHLGGEDFDNRIIEHFVKLINQKHKRDISKNQQALARLRKAVEGAKRRLSSHPEARVEVDGIVEGFDLSERLTRGKFEELCMDLFKGTLEPVKGVLADSQLSKEEVDEVVLVGGSTRIPKVQSLIREFFNGKEPNRGINPDEAVAYGAAVHGGVLSGATKLSSIIIADVVSLSLGIETIGGVMLPIIPRNSPIPTSKSQQVTTTTDNQPTIEFQVFEGERSMTKDNRLLGKFTLSGIKKAPRGQAQVEVKMDVDENGILHVKATDLDGGATEAVEIANDENRLSAEEIERMVEEAKEFEEADKTVREKAQAKVGLEQIAFEYRSKASSDEWKAVMTEEDQKVVEEAGADGIKWLDENPDAGKEEIEAKLQDIRSRAQDIFEATKKAVEAGGGGAPSNDEDAPTPAQDEAPVDADQDTAGDDESDEF